MSLNTFVDYDRLGTFCCQACIGDCRERRVGLRLREAKVTVTWVNICGATPPARLSSAPANLAGAGH